MEQLPEWIEQNYRDAKLINELLAENVMLRDQNIALSSECLEQRERVFTFKALLIALIIGFGSLFLAEQLTGIVLPLL